MDATIAGMRPDPRVRQPQLREIMELYRDVAHRKQGAIVFLAGEPGCGRSATLAALGEALRAEKDKPFIVSGVIAAGQYTPLGMRIKQLSGRLNRSGAS